MTASGYIYLIHELLMLARSDLQYGMKIHRGEYVQNKHDALMFIDSEWFESLCIAVNLDPEAVRDQFIRTTKTARSTEG